MLENYEESAIQVFPLALTRHYGNLQAKVPACVIQDEIERTDKFLRNANTREDANGRRAREIITGHTSNYYNTSAHAIRDSNSAFDCAKGDLTKEFAGTHAADVKSKNICAKLHGRHRVALPTTRLKSKLDDSNADATPVPREMRLEHVYKIDIEALKPENRTGE
jgi:hypothetical protein